MNPEPPAFRSDALSTALSRKEKKRPLLSRSYVPLILQKCQKCLVLRTWILLFFFAFIADVALWFIFPCLGENVNFWPKHLEEYTSGRKIDITWVFWTYAYELLCETWGNSLRGRVGFLECKKGWRNSGPLARPARLYYFEFAIAYIAISGERYSEYGICMRLHVISCFCLNFVHSFFFVRNDGLGR